MAHNKQSASIVKTKLVQLDGRTLEGGGQLLRVALCLSALTGTPVEIDNIRGNRSSGGGLKAQHLACVNWLSLATKAKTTGAEKGSKKLLFEPDVNLPGLQPAYTKKSIDGQPDVLEAIVDIGTAGSTGLVLQAVLPYILFATPGSASSASSVRLELKGGTNVSGSPSFEYVSQVLLPTLQAIGLSPISCKLLKRGWSQGRASAGAYILEIPMMVSLPLPAFERVHKVIRKTPSKPYLTITFLGPYHIHKHFKMVMLPAIQHHFGENYIEDSDSLEIVCEDSGDDKKLYLIIVVTVSSGDHEYKLGSDWLYDRKIRLIERSVTEMCERVAANIYDEWKSGACVDEHMRDQLVIFEALAKGTRRIWPGQQSDGTAREPSLHARTAEWVAKEMLGVQFTAENTCIGAGFDGADQLAARLSSVSI